MEVRWNVTNESEAAIFQDMVREEKRRISVLVIESK